MSELLPPLASLARALRGPLSFLRDDPDEIHRLMPELMQLLPLPQKIYLVDEGATPLLGYPVLNSAGMKGLREALASYVRAEEEAQVAPLLRQAVDAPGLQSAWERYRALLARATENVTTSSYGRHFPDLFWLLHSLDVAKLLKETPRRITRLNLNLGKEQGGALKYKVFYRYLDRVLSLTYDLAHRLAGDTEELEEEIFPPLLSRMRDNLFVFTEDHVSPDLEELATTCRVTSRWTAPTFAPLRQARRVAADEQLAATPNCAPWLPSLRTGPPTPARCCARRPPYLACCPATTRRASPAVPQLWEALLRRLKEFEVFSGLRRLVVPVEQTADGLISLGRRCAASAASRWSCRERPGHTTSCRPGWWFPRSSVAA